ncbi:hypothetical protein GUJ93_ZPchr0006g43534 [Zizania palustris]|uniref:Uncharacterized protein n=1 Tax=Zizania palustris TaxID=103762 RepID=A0A8J5T2J2_ZIZPA|nr:hypothetical protein GUJ93_ZPchr0006g43534 [Zizania palustris]
MQALTDLKQAITGVLAQLGLAPMASTLLSFPNGVTGFLTAPSPSPVAVVEQGEGGNWTWWLGTEGGAAGGKGGTATGQTLAELPLSRATFNSFERVTREADKAPPTVEAQSRVESL